MQRTNGLSREGVLALRGLRLPGAALKRLRQTGIYCEPAISIEHQNRATRYVIRGLESGGAVADVGEYCGFVGVNGEPLAWLQQVDSVGRNGIHAVVVAPQLVRIQVFRAAHTYELLITQHQFKPVQERQRPALDSSMVFHGVHGTVALELWGNDSRFKGQVFPVFYARSGDQMPIPEQYRDMVCRITTAVCCIGCRHCHLLEASDAATRHTGTTASAVQELTEHLS